MVELALAPDGQSAALGYAGDTLNTAIYLKRCAPKLEVAYVTRLGQDDFSQGLLGFMAGEELETTRVEVSSTRQVGLYATSTDAQGERSFTYWRGQSAAREMFQSGAGADFSALEGVDLIYLSAISLAILPDGMRGALLDWLRDFRSQGGRVAFDSNYRPRLWETPEQARQRIGEAWCLTDIGLPSLEDERAVFADRDPPAVLARLHASGVREGALKCGDAGPISLGDPVAQDYPPAAHVVDTTAAGDSFNGAYLAARLTGASQAEALLSGHRLAAQVVGVKGAIAPKRPI